MMLTISNGNTASSLPKHSEHYQIGDKTDLQRLMAEKESKSQPPRFCEDWSAIHKNSELGAIVYIA
jgi:hypothetical protein